MCSVVYLHMHVPSSSNSAILPLPGAIWHSSASPSAGPVEPELRGGPIGLPGLTNGMRTKIRR